MTRRAVFTRPLMVDPWWNPAVEEQAMDRVHRLGQTRAVEVVRFAMRDTIEVGWCKLKPVLYAHDSSA